MLVNLQVQSNPQTVMENLTVFAKSSPSQATAKVVIKDFLEVMELNEARKEYKSDRFMVGDREMQIGIYPNGCQEEHNGFVSVVLWNNSDTDVTVNCQLFTEATKGNFNQKVRGKYGFVVDHFLSHAQ